MKETCPTFTSYIYIAGDISDAKRVCREYCMNGFCVSVSPADYIYKMGHESGVVVRVINYPRFPESADSLKAKCYDLATLLMRHLCQGSFTIEHPDEMIFFSRRD